MGNKVKDLPPLPPEEQDAIEADFMAMVELIPDDELRKAVAELTAAGDKLSLDKIDTLLKLAQRFKCSIPRVMVRMFQVFPEVRRKFQICD